MPATFFTAMSQPCDCHWSMYATLTTGPARYESAVDADRAFRHGGLLVADQPGVDRVHGRRGGDRLQDSPETAARSARRVHLRSPTPAWRPRRPIPTPCPRMTRPATTPRRRRPPRPPRRRRRSTLHWPTEGTSRSRVDRRSITRSPPRSCPVRRRTWCFRRRACRQGRRPPMLRRRVRPVARRRSRLRQRHQRRWPRRRSRSPERREAWFDQPPSA